MKAKPGPGGGPPGDLYVVVHVQEHAFFQRDGNDLYCEIPLNFPTSRSVARSRFRRSTAMQEASTIPAGTQSGATFRVRGKRHARRERARPRRSAGHGQGEHAEKADEGPEEAARAAGGVVPNEAFEPTPTSEQTDKGLFERVKDIFG